MKAVDNKMIPVAASKYLKAKVKPLLTFFWKSLSKWQIGQQSRWEWSWILFIWGEVVLQSELNFIEIFVTMLEKSQTPGLKV